MKLAYECDICEDIEWWEEKDFVEGVHCECGGHLFLRKRDNYRKAKKLSKCLTCKNSRMGKAEKSRVCKTCYHYR